MWLKVCGQRQEEAAGLFIVGNILDAVCHSVSCILYCISGIIDNIAHGIACVINGISGAVNDIGTFVCSAVAAGGAVVGAVYR